MCHGELNRAQVLEDGVIRSLYVDPEDWAKDVHKMGGLTCVDCHIHANPYVHFREGFMDVDCAKCHPEQSEEYLKNVHFASVPLSPDRELPLCYHCHTKHHILRHDDPSASIHADNIDVTCGECHPEVMVKGMLKGSSIGKISGHRKGDISEKFDMDICIQCHNPAHGSNTVYREFCTRCHDPDQSTNVAIGPTHLDSTKWMTFNTVGGGLVLFLILGTSVYLGFKSRGELGQRLKNWHDSMKLLEELEETRDEDPSEGEDKKQESIVNEEETEKTKEEGEGEGDGISEDVDPGGSEPETDDK
ncbi:MAG: cytochrome c3 family protein [Candidatus Aminicenantes bacterium]